MRTRLPLFAGVFMIMALSNAIVPVLPSLAPGTALQGAIYAAYFLGAFILVLPAGFLADRIGEIPLIRAGLLFTCISGVLLSLPSSPMFILAARIVEGVGAGLFVPASLALLNSMPGHERQSGYFMALMNLGLLVGLLFTGWLVPRWIGPYSGIVLFSVASFVPLALSLGMNGKSHGRPEVTPETAEDTFARMKAVFSSSFWLWVSAVVIIGITGALTALHPEYSNLSPEIVSQEIAMMNLATIAAVMITSHARLPPVPAIRAAAIAMAAGVVVTFFSVWGFLIIGWMAGMVMISQLAYLANLSARQGVLMGLFNTASYGGMTLLPFLSGLIAQLAGFPAAFAALAVSALLVAATIGRCTCSVSVRSP
ncbi:MAG: Multidrug resistance protein MdtH [Methanoregulaceae archaeon PtaB.Bin108]|nr:MAG: Multidrug resistance protein MdtH [Methanoregulaceae archaeon PtaB.Bin108]